jgi:hypothetical protein
MDHPFPAESLPPLRLTRRDALRAAVSCAAWILAGQVPAAEIDYAALIDIAGRQRMLTQRIVKAYCQIGLGVTPDASRVQLHAAVRRFEGQLAELSRRAPAAAARGVLERMDAAWRPFRRAALGPVDRARGRLLATQGDAVLEAAHALVLVLEQAAGTPLARLVNIAGRQRMLSQRLAKLYMLRAWDIEPPGGDDARKAAADEFAGALAALRAAPENTPSIAGELEEIAVQWQWFTAALSRPGDAQHALVVADASEAILDGMDRIVAMYAKVVSR